jgi:hypothetical protein
MRFLLGEVARLYSRRRASHLPPGAPHPRELISKSFGAPPFELADEHGAQLLEAGGRIVDLRTADSPSIMRAQFVKWYDERRDERIRGVNLSSLKQTG